MKPLLASLALTIGLGLSLIAPASADIFGEIGNLPKSEEDFGGTSGSLGYMTSSPESSPILFFVNRSPFEILPGETATQFIQRTDKGYNSGYSQAKRYAFGYFSSIPTTGDGSKYNKKLFVMACEAAFKTGGNIPENLIREHARLSDRSMMIPIVNAYRYTLGRRPTVQEAGAFSKDKGANFYSTFLQLHKNLITNQAQMDGVLDRAYFATMGRKASAAEKAYWWTNRVQGESYANLCVIQRRWIVSGEGLNDAVGAIQQAVRNATGGKVLPADSPNLLKLYELFTHPRVQYGFDDLSEWAKDPEYTSGAITSQNFPIPSLEQAKKFQAVRLKAIKSIPPKIKTLK